MASILESLRRKIERMDRFPALPLDHRSRRFSFFEIGFHGDRYLLQLVDLILENCGYFIETGTNVGSTLAYVARTYPHIECSSCEPDFQAFQYAVKNTTGLSNVSIYNETSQIFLKRIAQHHTYLLAGSVSFWLDAHGDGFKWPLRDELAFITTNFKAAYVLIDDFKVPGLDCFGYDEYQDQECSLDYIEDVLNPQLEYCLYYPTYRERTSRHHPLRGWGLIEFGHDGALKLSNSLRGKVRIIRTARPVERGSTV